MNIVTLALTLIMIFFHFSSVIYVTALLFLLGFVTNASVIVYGLAATMIPGASSTMVGVINMINMAGAALVQVLMGWILSITGTFSSTGGNFYLAMAVMPLMLLLSLLFLPKKN
jgi:hypothetical protein